MKILVVDDEDIVLSSCRLVLEAENFEVVLAGSVEQALAVIKTEIPALLLIDVKMPALDGMYLMEQVKAKWPQIPIIVMSGYPTSETITEAAEKGAAGFIAKPFTPDELLEAVKSIFHKEECHGEKEGLGN